MNGGHAFFGTQHGRSQRGGSRCFSSPCCPSLAQYQYCDDLTNWVGMFGGLMGGGCAYWYYDMCGSLSC